MYTHTALKTGVLKLSIYSFSHNALKTGALESSPSLSEFALSNDAAYIQQINISLASIMRVIRIVGVARIVKVVRIMRIIRNY